MNPFISICIPSYKRVAYLERLLDSIAIQEYKHFEVVISDDSPGDEVRQLCSLYADKFQLWYSHNNTSLGTPENWNEAIRQAKGRWIKIMHDDDWFVDGKSLIVYANAVESNPQADFLFSAYRNVYEEQGNKSVIIRLSKSNEKKLRESILCLFQRNYIGNPSCTLFHKKENLLFDSRFKWVVDFEFYMRYLTENKTNFFYIDQPLINASLNASQVTSAVFRDATVEIPENHLLLEKMRLSILRNVYVYDYFWRSYRNLGIKDKRQVVLNGYAGQIPAVLASMIRWQKSISGKLLFIGAISKSLMLLHYILHRGKIPGK